MIGDKTFPWAHRLTGGTIHHKNLYNLSLGYTETRKKVAGASDTAVHAGIASTTGSQTITTGFTNPDVPRAIRLAFADTTGDIAAGVVEVFGTNVEGQPISEEFVLSANQSADIDGVKAFKTVTRVDVPPMDGTGATITVGYSNALGVNHRLYANNTTVKVYSSTDVASRIPPTLQAAPTVVTDEVDVEFNLVTPATAPDGTTFLSILYVYDYWATAPLYDDPIYLLSTSTSTSSTTATTTSTSTSSTSISTSSTSTSLSTSSTSTSSTSTSTTTTP